MATLSWPAGDGPRPQGPVGRFGFLSGLCSLSLEAKALELSVKPWELSLKLHRNSLGRSQEPSHLWGGPLKPLCIVIGKVPKVMAWSSWEEVEAKGPQELGSLLKTRSQLRPNWRPDRPRSSCVLASLEVVPFQARLLTVGGQASLLPGSLPSTWVEEEKQCV